MVKKVTEQKSLTKVERVKKLKALMDNGDILCTGDQLIMERTTPEGPMAVPVALFLRKQDDPDTVWLATPTGVLLFECNDFHKFAQEKCKELFLKNLDTMLKQKTAIMDIRVKKVN